MLMLYTSIHRTDDSRILVELYKNSLRISIGIAVVKAVGIAFLVKRDLYIRLKIEIHENNARKSGHLLRFCHLK